MSELQIQHNYCYVLRGAAPEFECTRKTEAFFSNPTYAHFVMIHGDASQALLEDWTATVYAQEPSIISWSLRVILWEGYLWIICSVQQLAVVQFTVCAEATGHKVCRSCPLILNRGGGVRFPFWSNSAYTLAPASLIA